MWDITEGHMYILEGDFFPQFFTLYSFLFHQILQNLSVSWAQ